MLTLFHNAVSTCSQKVRWILSEKNMDFTSREIDLLAGEQHADWYIKIHPDHMVPALVHDETIIRESSLIMMYLDQIGDGERFIPDNPLEAHQMRSWLHLIDHTIHAEAAVVTFSLGPRNLINAQPADVREAAISNIVDPIARAQRRSVLDLGVMAPEFKRAVERFIKMLTEIEAQLQRTPWLAGPKLSIADGAVLPYVLRLEHLGLDTIITPYPAVAAWLSSMKQRPSFANAVGQWIPEEVLAFMKQMAADDQEAIQNLLDEIGNTMKEAS
ncbi:MAG: glutathione S-transferase family protein [Parvibaculaceae bacterium]|nr:glutathione S-transferase family protein [Parvibaculaceae bacterium]HBM90236.1 glutathione S-transferase family protein [Rhodobiaceae bacterium]